LNNYQYLFVQIPYPFIRATRSVSTFKKDVVHYCCPDSRVYIPCSVSRILPPLGDPGSIARTLTDVSVALWSPGMFGYNYPYQSSDPINHSYNTNEPVVPLRASHNLTQEQWWGHGHLDYPPNEGDFLELPAGGVYTGELACNRADSMMRDPVRQDVQPDHACGVSHLSFSLDYLGRMLTSRELGHCT